MAPFVESLGEVGYVSGETLFGAPNDFRYGLAAEGHASQLRRPVCTPTSQPKFTLLAPKIYRFVALSAPWGGTVQEMLTFASGSSFEVPLVDPQPIRGEQRSSESNLWLMPSPKLFGPGKTLIVTPSKAYSAYDIRQILYDIGFPEGPDVVYGDGTVNLVSLLALESLWSDEKSQPLKVIRISGISHTLILKDNAPLDEIIVEISSINSQAKVQFA
ncbi:hypothetical protein CRYUN_Cryun27aG0072800 [Craigia yunnanensis]